MRHAIETPDGRILTQRAVLNRVAGILRMGEYRIRRESKSRFVLDATPRAFVTQAGETDVRRAVRELFGEVDLAVKMRDAFPVTLKTHAFVVESCG